MFGHARHRGPRLAPPPGTPAARRERYSHPPPAAIHGDPRDERTPDPEAARAIEILSHELRSPITTLHLGTKVLRSGQRPQGQVREEVIEVLEAEADRLFRLIEDLLAVARHEGSGAPLPSRPLLLQRWLPAVISSESAASPGLRLRALIDPDLPPVLADDGGLAHVVRNLIANAGRFGPEGAPVEIVVERATDDAVRMRVLDRGPGIDPEEAEQLFTPFYRSPRTATEGGAGLGLAAARRLLRAMDATIEARPREGGGAELAVTLPALDVDEDVDAIDPGEAPRS